MIPPGRGNHGFGLRLQGLLFIVAATGCRPSAAQPLPQPEPGLGSLAAVAAERDRIVEVVAGTESTCARTKAGRVACIGQAMAYSAEQPAIDTHVPQVIDVPPSKAISAGSGFACSVDRDGGRVRCWGYSQWGQLGRKTPSSFDHWPLEVPNLAGVDEISSLGTATCARSGRQVSCWPGSGEDGAPLEFELEAGEGSPRLSVRLDDPDEPEPRLTYGTHTLEEAAPALDGVHTRNYRESLGRPWFDGDGSWCGWLGGGKPAQCGHQYTSHRVEIEVSAGMEFGSTHGCAATGGTVVCRGSSEAGQVAPDGVQLGEAVIDIAVGAEHSCAVTQSGSLHCWGSSARGQVGFEPIEPRPPRIVATHVARVWAKATQTCLETTAGEFRCTGLHTDPCAKPSFTPVRGPRSITGLLDPPDAWGCVVDEESSIWCYEDGQWANLVPAGSLGGASVPKQQFTIVSEALCWLEGGKAVCSHRPRARTFEEVETRKPLQSFGPPEKPFGDRGGFVRLQAVDEFLCSLNPVGDLACAKRVEPRSASGGKVEWVDVELTKTGVAQLTADTLVFEDGTAEHIHSHEFRRRDGSKYPALWDTQLTASEAHPGVKQAARYCVLLESGKIYCDEQTEPQIDEGRFTSLVGAEDHLCALDDEHKLWCWGAAGAGQLGDEEPACTRAPNDLTAAFQSAWRAAR